MRSHLRLLLLLVAVVWVPVLGACGRDSRLVVYSGRTSNLITPLLEQFSEETGIKIDVRYGDSAELALLVEEEGDRSPADVFISQSPGATGYLAGRGRLRQLTDVVMAPVPSDYRGPDGRWVGVTGRVRTLVYNTEMVDRARLPASVVDLTQPPYRGMVAVAPSNGSFQDFVSGLRQLRGDAAARAFLEGLAANGAEAYANNTAIVEAVARGEIEMGLVNHYYIARAKAEDAGVLIDTHFFAAGDPGRLLLITAGGILDSADKAGEAARLLDYLLGDEAQRFFARETFEYPLARDSAPVASVPDLDVVEPTVVDLDSLGGDLEDTIEMIEASGLGR